MRICGRRLDTVVPGIVIFFRDFGVAEGVPLEIFADRAFEGGAYDCFFLFGGEGEPDLIVVYVQHAEDTEHFLDLVFDGDGREVEKKGVLDLLRGHGDRMAGNAEELYDRHALAPLGDRIDRCDPAGIVGFVVIHPVEDGQSAVCTLMPHIEEYMLLGDFEAPVVSSVRTVLFDPAEDLFGGRVLLERLDESIQRRNRNRS